jgi:hypothetical protein
MLIALIAVVAASEPTPALTPTVQANREVHALQQSRPGLAGDLVSLAFGLFSTTAGAVGLHAGLQGSWEGPNTTFIGIGVALLVPGVIGAVIGLVKLWLDLGRRNEIDQRILELQQEGNVSTERGFRGEAQTLK